MAVTLEQITAQLAAFQVARDAARDAHTATTDAQTNVITVTAVEQGLIDAAVAHYDVATTEAQTQATAAQAAEVVANEVEDDAYETLVLSLTAFKNEQ